MPTVINPATGEEIDQYSFIDKSTAFDRIQAAAEAQRSWAQTSFEQRAERMNAAADQLEADKDELAEIMTREMGKTLKEARSEVEKCAWVCRYYAEHAASFLENEPIDSDASTSFVSFEALGVILAVMPWNYPLWQVFRFAAPGLMAGNAGVLKHASNVPACAKAITRIFQKAGFPENLFTHLLIDTDLVEAVIEHPLIKAVTLTGSEKAGSAVASAAAKKIKKSVLELGGSDAYLILADADLEHAVDQCVQSRLLNAGQSCIGAKRFIVVEEVYEGFLSLFIEKMRAKKMGDPTKEETDFGPMARTDLRDDLHKQVEKSIAQGARLELGGQIPAGPGAYYPATILSNIPEGSPAWEEELFGPVASVFRAKDEEDAIRIANTSTFGLGAAVFTRDIEKGQLIAEKKLEAGCCFVNAFVRSDPRLPFGGIKSSGYGRELSHYGIKEFVNIKTVYIR